MSEVVSVIRYDGSRKPFVFDETLLKPTEPSTRERYLSAKPPGVWFSVGDSWKRFVKDEMPEDSKNRWRFAHRFTVDKKDMICIESASDANNLFSKFGQYTENKAEAIDWTKVARANKKKCGVLVMFSRIYDEISSVKGPVPCHKSWIYGWDSDSVVLYKSCKSLRPSIPSLRPLYEHS